MGYCTWAGMNEANQIYHDTEWGIPVHDDRQMFEHLTLECLQCGLSWDLMLKKREIFRECFCNFEYDCIATFGDEDAITPGAIRKCGRSSEASVITSGDTPGERRYSIRAMIRGQL